LAEKVVIVVDPAWSVVVIVRTTGVGEMVGIAE